MYEFRQVVRSNCIQVIRTKAHIVYAFDMMQTWQLACIVKAALQAQYKQVTVQDKQARVVDVLIVVQYQCVEADKFVEEIQILQVIIAIGICQIQIGYALK
jgi:hypothetical protein